MYRKFIATIAAASIALTALGASPAFAGEKETARAIAAILGLAVVGKLIHDKNERKKERREEVSRGYHNPQPSKPHRPEYRAPSYTPPAYHTPKPRPLPDRVNRNLLPQQCFQSFDTRRGKVRMFPSRCLERHYTYAYRLPPQCEYIFDTPRGNRRGYEARCLRDKGYRLARG